MSYNPVGKKSDVSVKPVIKEFSRTSLDCVEWQDTSSEVRSNSRKKVLQGICSLGILPLGRLCFKTITPLIFLPARNFNKETINEQLNGYLNPKHIPNEDNKNRLTSLKITTVDNAEIDGMIFWNNSADKNYENKKWIIYFPGNGEFYEGRLDEAQQLAKDTGANILFFNYRGVGQSKGDISRAENLITDGSAVLNYLKAQNVPEENILLWGHSLGGGVSTQVAARNEKVNLLVSRTFSSIQNQAKDMIPIVGRPIGFFLKVFDWNLNSQKKWDDFLENRKEKVGILYHDEDQLISKASSLWQSFSIEQKANLQEFSVHLEDLRLPVDDYSYEMLKGQPYQNACTQLMWDNQNKMSKGLQFLNQFIPQLSNKLLKEKNVMYDKVYADKYNELLNKHFSKEASQQIEDADIFSLLNEIPRKMNRANYQESLELLESTSNFLHDLIVFSEKHRFSNDDDNHIWKAHLPILKKADKDFRKQVKKFTSLSKEDYTQMSFTNSLGNKVKIQNPHNYTYTSDNAHYENITQLAVRLLSSSQ